jgi:hypothetical protein
MPTAPDPGRSIGPAKPGVPNPHAAGGMPTSRAPEAAGNPHETGEKLPPLEPGKGTFTGKLVVKTPGDAQQEGIEVRLFAFKDQQRVAEWRSETDAQGRFSFEKLNTSTGVRYIASALFQGVIYLSEGTEFPAGSDKASTELSVYESVAAPASLKMASAHVILSGAEGGGIQLTEVIAIENPGDKTVIGSAENTQTLTLDLPEGATNVELVQGLLANQTAVTEKALIYSGPFYPGNNQLVFSYVIAPQPTWLFRRRLTLPVETFDIFVPSGGPAILSPQLARGEPLRIQETNYDRYSGGPFQATGISFQIGGVEGASSTGTRELPVIPITVGAGLLLLYMVLAPFFSRARNLQPGMAEVDAQARSRALWTMRRDRAMAAVKELDFDFQSGKLSDDDYEQLRTQQKALAIAAMQELDALTAAEARGAGRPGGESVTEAGASVGAAAGAGASDEPRQLRFCPSCGFKLQPGEKFCGGCGIRLPGLDG